MFMNYVKSMLEGREFMPLMNVDGGSGNDGGDGGDGGDDDKGGQGQGDGDGGDGEGEKVTFTDEQQAFIDALIKKNTAKERAKAEADRKKAEKEAADRAQMTADQKAEADREAREKAAQAKEAKANERIVNLEIKDVARELGVSQKKIERFLKIVDRDELEVDENGDVDRAAVELAVKAVLADMPEFKGSDQQRGPDADFNKGGGVGAKFTRDQIANMSPQEVAANYDDVMKSMAIHNKQ